MVDTAAIIGAKRRGEPLDGAMLTHMADGLADGSVSDAQAGAFAMAVCVNGMTEAERVAWTCAMRDTGEVMAWDLPGPVVDKHSTGGVGDAVSLVLAPALAAAGAYVPMISGRGLGHTGGTLDKLGAIPGYDIAPSEETFRRVVRETGAAIIGQTDALAPADRRLYAIRDVTGTVESLDLIVASILSKKLAAGLDRLVLDVKFGNGAIMQAPEEARALGQALVSVANGAGCATTAFLTDMNEPLASAAGNALEVAQCIRLLKGDEVDARLWDVTVALGGAALGTDGREVADALQSGAAAEAFGAMVAGLGGPSDLMDAPEKHLPAAPIIEDVDAGMSGIVTAIDTAALGRAVVALGGGRRQPDDTIDPAVGLDWILGLGQSVEPDTPLARVHARDSERAAEAAAAVRAAYTVAPGPFLDEMPLIADRIEP